MRTTLSWMVMGVVLAAAGCGDDESAGASNSGGSGVGAAAGSGGSTAGAGGARWSPGTTYATEREPSERGFLDRRGLIHAHSVYSHDACDGEPRDETTGAINQKCFDDFRRDICLVKHDFVFLSDHRESFSTTEFPEVLLYRADRGDELVERNGVPVANRAGCDDSHAVMIMGGSEAGTMPVGLEGHISTDQGERSRIYGDATAESMLALKAGGAVVLQAHTEDRSVDDLVNLPYDGFEMYNLHANLFLRVGEAFALIAQANNNVEALPHPDLIVLPLASEDPAYLDTWGSVLARGAKRVTTMGTDCHRNTFTQLMPDGERVDSYRRMMMWFSNHLLVRPEADGSWNDSHLKDALRAGRLYGAWEILGYPVGFDFHAREGAIVREMGETTTLANGTQLHVSLPTVQDLDPRLAAPVLKIRILRAREGGWDVVHESDTSTDYTPPQAGAYRAEIRMEPRHLESFLSSYADLARTDFFWIYSNPIYVE